MPRNGKRPWSEEFLEETKNRKVPGGGTNPFATPLPKAHKKLKNERPNYNV
jgi:hypothetical protein